MGGCVLGGGILVWTAIVDDRSGGQRIHELAWWRIDDLMEADRGVAAQATGRRLQVDNGTVGLHHTDEPVEQKADPLLDREPPKMVGLEWARGTAIRGRSAGFRL